MKLPPSLLQNILHGNIQPAPAALVVERFPLRVAAEVTLLDSNHRPADSATCAVLDISQMGVALGTDLSVSPGTAFVLRLKDADQNDILIECQAVRVQQAAPDRKLQIVAARYVQMAEPASVRAAEDPTISAIRAAILG